MSGSICHSHVKKMIKRKDSWSTDLRVASSFIRSIETGRPDLDFELQDLARHIERLAEIGPDRPLGSKTPTDDLEAA